MYVILFILPEKCKYLCNVFVQQNKIQFSTQSKFSKHVWLCRITFVRMTSSDSWDFFFLDITAFTEESVFFFFEWKHFPLFTFYYVAVFFMYKLIDWIWMFQYFFTLLNLSSCEKSYKWMIRHNKWIKKKRFVSYVRLCSQIEWK